MPIDIAFSLNRTLQIPLKVAINSILHNADTDNADSEHSLEPFRFNIVVPAGDSTMFLDSLQATFSEPIKSGTATFRVQEFEPPDYLKQYLDNKFKEKKAERRLSRYMQYSRLFLKTIFPDMQRVIYLDCDTLVLGNMHELYAQGSQLVRDRYLAAVPHVFPAVFYFSNPFKIWPELRKFKRTFNSGVLLTDLSYWTEATYDLLKHYLALDAENSYRLYHLGDETIFNLMFKETYLPLDSEWNACGYGQGHFISRLISRPVEQMKIIHWSGGHHKPWESEKVIYSNFWREYLPQEA